MTVPTPDTEEVRDAFCWALGGVTLTYDPSGEELFDRWLALIKAEVWDEGFRDGYGDGLGTPWNHENPYREKTT